MSRSSSFDRYAKALFEIDTSPEHLERHLSAFDAVIAVLKAHPDMMLFFKAPQIPLSAKKKLLRDCFDEKVDGRFVDFLELLLRKDRFEFFPQIALHYRARVNRALGVWVAELTTAVPVGLEVEMKLQEKLENLFQKEIVIHKKVDPKVIGGAILVVANEMIDWSVAGRLRRMKETLLS